MARQKYISKQKFILFGKYYKKPVVSLPITYLYWMLQNLDLTIWEQRVIDSALMKKTNNPKNDYSGLEEQKSIFDNIEDTI